MGHLQQIPPCTVCKCHIYHSPIKKRGARRVHLRLGGQKKSVPLLFSSVQDPLQWQKISEHSENVLDHIRYSPELSRFSWELGSEI